ncbi:putative membrane protein [Neorhizobium huautlense]|uniref:Membrane protein n=1 Tax=Neorhizobium huautlense TaxID=67774 RepID=A0ABT9PY68_9HYPH|nr:TIGR01620 family protein [Neorhizobium huautlense]MDP9839428.1 putative membrane protein [Neorhizobium huautlense]
MTPSDDRNNRPTPPSSETPSRRPTAYAVEGERDMPLAASRPPRSFDDGFTATADADDPFLGVNEDDLADTPVALPRRHRFSFGKLAAGAFGVFASFAFGLWADSVIRDLFSRSDWLGYTAVGILCVALAALAVVVGREVLGLMRIGAVQSLKADVAAIETGTNSATGAKSARALVTRLTTILSHRAETAHGRAALDATKEEIIDGPNYLDLAERELMTPLDREARLLILAASKRVSVVTAISPRAVVDLAYVLFEVSRLVRAMAELYGGRPGTLGMFRLLRDVIAHLAVTGSIAVGDSIAQQVLGHGLAARLSTRLGEGVINGLLTARIGIAAMDLCRPLPFRALKRPGIGDFMGDIVATSKPKDPT